jgi:hypothetical protein
VERTREREGGSIYTKRAKNKRKKILKRRLQIRKKKKGRSKMEGMKAQLRDSDKKKR